MGKHVCLKEWFNGNEISVSIDDNLNDTFRAEVIVFRDKERIVSSAYFMSINTIEVGHCRHPTHLAELLLKAQAICLNRKGNIKPFDSRILTDNETNAQFEAKK